MDISLSWTQRSYGGKKFRPSTIVHNENPNQLLICVTTWGRAEIAEKVIESLKNFVSMASDDEDLTLAYERKENLHKMGNILRMAVITASEKIYSQYNKDEYTTGFEVFAAVKDGPQWIYVSCGQPSLILYRKDLGMLPLTQAIDLNVLTLNKSLIEPLPSQLLGLGQNPPIQYGNIRLQNQDRLALISRTYLPHSFYKIESQDFNQDTISRVLAQDHQDIPFWLGLLTINEL